MNFFGTIQSACWPNWSRGLRQLVPFISLLGFALFYPFLALFCLLIFPFYGGLLGSFYRVFVGLILKLELSLFGFLFKEESEP